MKRVLIFQHMDHDTVGRFADFFAEDRYQPTTVRLWEGEEVPSLAHFDLLFVLGGPQDVWQTEEHPWLTQEKAAIREWVGDRGKPYIGICLGHQLLAESMGGKVAPAAQSEVGVHKVTIAKDGAKHPLFSGLEGQHHVMQWHHAEVQVAPSSAEVLASSASTDVQALAIGDCAMGLQFHAEFTPQTVASWQSLPGHLNALTETLGMGAYERLSSEAYPLMPAMGSMTRRIYSNFKSFAGLDSTAVSLARRA